MYAWSAEKRSPAGNLWHGLTHSCARMEKPGMGVLVVCQRRGPRARAKVFYQPALSGAGWYPIDGADLFKAVGSASSPEEAMAILRKAEADAGQEGETTGGAGGEESAPEG